MFLWLRLWIRLLNRLCLHTCVQLPGPGDGSRLWSWLGVHSRDAARWWLGGPLVQEAVRRKCFFIWRYLLSLHAYLYFYLCYYYYFFTLAKSPWISTKCDHCGRGRDVQGWQTDYIWPDQKGKLYGSYYCASIIVSYADSILNKELDLFVSSW